MKLSNANRDLITSEIKFSLEKMKEEKDDKVRLYYFSAVYGIMQRIFNLEYSPDLIFAHFVLNSTYNSVNMRLLNPDQVIKLPENLMDKLIKYTEELLDAIENDRDLYDILLKYTLLGYVTKGNGYFLYQKGLLKI